VTSFETLSSLSTSVTDKKRWKRKRKTPSRKINYYPMIEFPIKTIKDHNLEQDTKY